MKITNAVNQKEGFKMDTKIATYKFSNREVKELRYSTEDLKSIQWAEKQKARLENAGFNLKSSSVGFTFSTLGYVKYNQ